MRIYATKTPSLESYLGKDVWVKCLKHGASEPCYVRIESRSTYPGSTYLEGNVFYEHVLSYKDVNDIRSELSNFNDLIDPADYKIVTPAVTLRAEDIYPEGAAPEYLDTLDKYVGKDLWVKVFSYLYNFECYINIISIDGDKIKYHAVDAGMIDYYSPSDWDYEGLPSVEDLDYVETTTLDTLDLIVPVEVMSTDEIIEELNACAEHML